MKRKNTSETVYRTLFILFVIFLAASSAAHAEDYGTYTGRKLGRGLTNTALGWTEVPARIEKVGDEHGPIAGLIWGTIDGVGNTVKRTAIGVYEVVTFPVKTSDTSEPLIEPEFSAIAPDRAGYRPKDYSF